MSVAALAVTSAARADEPGPRKLDSDILAKPLAQFDQMVKEGWTLDKGYDRENYTPLMTAIERGRADLVEWLLRKGAQPNRVDDLPADLSEAGMNDRAVTVLTAVLARAPDRTVAYLNVADAEYAQGWKDEARDHYRAYLERMRRESKAAKVPPRVAERIAEP